MEHRGIKIQYVRGESTRCGRTSPANKLPSHARLVQRSKISRCNLPYEQNKKQRCYTTGHIRSFGQTAGHTVLVTCTAVPMPASDRWTSGSVQLPAQSQQRLSTPAPGHSGSCVWWHRLLRARGCAAAEPPDAVGARRHARRPPAAVRGLPAAS